MPRFRMAHKCSDALQPSSASWADGRTARVACTPRVPMLLSRSAVETVNGSSCGKRPNVESGGTATPGRQDLRVGRALRPQEVRSLHPPPGDPFRPLRLGARAAGPLPALLTLRRALVWQRNEPQLQPAVDPRQAARGRPAGAASSSTTRRCQRACLRLAVVVHARVRAASSVVA